MKISRRVAAQLLLIFIAQSALMYRETESMKLLQAGAAYKRFLYYSNGNCETFDIRCFSQRDCQMAYGPGYQCVILRCSLSCQLLPSDRGRIA
ncbi:hypothetical protein BOX15_Mlig004136g2 [Macrostomum lignano]|uniref:Uncharacterized protein n=1 Tax=Macrostomum lignano TaxID=282301 RepID=A0A267FAB9_9PLAT|nr:hypothetical protein BOX15_Mlig004136g2 [Macrostomum lignano]